MTRATASIGLAAFFACSLIASGIAEDAALMVAFATPSLPTPTSYEAGEMPDAAPLSLLIQNQDRVDDRLLGGSTPAADRVEIHTSQLDHGVRQMLAMPQGITIPAGGTRLLELASDHLMLVGLRENLVQGQTFPLTLRFARAGDVTVTVRVRRKVDAAGLQPIPPVAAGNLTISLASVPPVAVSRPVDETARRQVRESANGQQPSASFTIPRHLHALFSIPVHC